MNGATVSYGYDALGRRVTRTDTAGTAQYLYGDPANPFLVTAARGADGLLTTFFYDEEDALFSLERGGVRYYFGSDQVGSPRLVYSVDASGAATVVKRINYDTFGNVMADSTGADFDLPIGFAGGLTDPVTGLVRFGMRDYEPASSRSYGGSSKNDFTRRGERKQNGSWGTKTEGKISLRGCARF